MKSTEGLEESLSYQRSPSDKSELGYVNEASPRKPRKKPIQPQRCIEVSLIGQTNYYTF